jgi:hypothetical protein
LQGKDDIPPPAPNTDDTVLLKIYDTPQFISVVQGEPPKSAIIIGDKADQTNFGPRATKVVNYSLTQSISEVDLTSDAEEEKEELVETQVVGGDETVPPTVMRVSPLYQSPPPHNADDVRLNTTLASIESSEADDTDVYNISGVVPMVNDTSHHFYSNIYELSLLF